MPLAQIETSLGIFGDRTFEIDYDYEPGDPGNISGPPDSWREPIAECIEINGVYAVDIPGFITGYNFVDLLPEAEIESLTYALEDFIHDRQVSDAGSRYDDND